MPYKTELDWTKVQAKSMELCHARLEEHLEGMNATSTRLFKRLKEAFFGKNVLSHHKTRLAAQLGKAVWGVAHHAVPGGDVAEQVRSTVATAGHLLVTHQVESGKSVPTWAKDLFEVETSFIHAKMAILYDELESILLWQDEFTERSKRPPETDGQLVGLIHAFEKLRFHYQQASTVTAQLNEIYANEYRKLENYADRWDLDQRERSEIFRTQTDILTKLLFTPEIHQRCPEGKCFFGKDPFDILSLYTTVLRLNPVDPQCLEIAKATYLTGANFKMLGGKQGFFAGQVQVLATSVLGAQGLRPTPSTTIFSNEEWKSFSSIIGFRGTETQGIDNAHRAYAALLSRSLAALQVPHISELNTSVAARAALRADLVPRVEALADLRRETRAYINAKSANASSKRRPYVLMLDVLAALEQESLERLCKEIAAE